MDVNETTNSTNDGYDIPAPLVTSVVFIMSVSSIFGTLGNILVIAAVYAHKKLRSVHNVFIINLTIADLTVTTIVIPLAVVGATDYGEYLRDNDDLCDFIGSLVVISCVTSILSIAHIALARYVYICFNHNYDKFYNRKTISLMVAGIWFYAIVVDIPNLEVVGWGKHGYNYKVQACSFLYSDVVESGYIWFLVVFGWGIPFVLICFCYTRIYLFVRQKSFSQRNATADATITSTRKGVKSPDDRVLRILAVIVFFFCLMWAPLPLSGFLNRYVIDLPDWVPFLFSHMAIANSCINFIILYAFHKEFKKGYGLVLKKITCCKILN